MRLSALGRTQGKEGDASCSVSRGRSLAREGMADCRTVTHDDGNDYQDAFGVFLDLCEARVAQLEPLRHERTLNSVFFTRR